MVIFRSCLLGSVRGVLHQVRNTKGRRRRRRKRGGQDGSDGRSTGAGSGSANVGVCGGENDGSGGNFGPSPKKI